MDILITFPGGKRVDARFGDLTVVTDQPVAAGGSGAAVTPFDLFLASLGTCVGYYVLAYCQARGLPTEGLGLVERVSDDPRTHLPARVDVEVLLPPGFPDQHRAGVQRAAEHCKVKKMLEARPMVAVHLADPVAAGVSAS
jgi:ribosomal protein S12 methylthiotransferase accessory factor